MIFTETNFRGDSRELKGSTRFQEASDKTKVHLFSATLPLNYIQYKTKQTNLELV